MFLLCFLFLNVDFGICTFPFCVPPIYRKQSGEAKRREQLQEEYEDALFALMMNYVTEAEWKRLWAENGT